VDLRRKLTSRKFWCAIVAFLTPLLFLFNIGQEVVAQVTLVITSVGALIAYIFSESSVDKENCKAGADK